MAGKVGAFLELKHTKKVYKIVAWLAFALVTFFMLVGFYSSFTIGHDGDYCNYVSEGQPYDLMVSDMRCSLTSNWFYEPLFIVVVPNLIVQAILFLGFLVVDFLLGKIKIKT